MKVNEILSEKQLNEALPVIAGIGLSTIFTTVTAFALGYSAFELYKLMTNYNEDPDSVTDDQWGDMFFDLALLAIPAVGRLGKAGVMKLVPAKVKRQIGKRFKAKILPKLKAQRAKNLSKAKNAKQLVKARQVNQKIRLAAKNRVQNFPKQLTNALSIGVATQYAVEYWEKMLDLEDQYKRYKDGDMTTEYFLDDPDKANAHQKYLELREIILGELVVGIGFAVGGIATAKAASFLGQVFGTAAGAATGMSLVGGLVKLPFDVASKLIQVTGPGMTLFLQTETGKLVLQNVLVQSITQGIGKLTSEALSLIGKTLDSLGMKSTAKTVTPSAPPPGVDTEKKPHPYTAGNVSSAPQLRVYVNPSDKNDVRINNVRVTDKDGYLDPDMAPTIKKIGLTAQSYGLPDPTKQIPKNPNATYNF
jgi:hypothetical protein